MSSLLYGSQTRRRLLAPADSTLVVTAGTDAGNVRRTTDAEGNIVDPAAEKIKTWQDALAGLVPAEVLALHAVAMSYGTETKGTGDSAITTITHPDEMRVVYVVLLILAFGLYVLGAKSLKKLNWVRAFIPVGAFVLWTMIQPSTAFDALDFELSTFARMMIAVFGAVVLGAVGTLLAQKADQAPPPTT